MGGWTLLECLVAMAIGGVISAGVMLALLAHGFATRHADALAEVHDNAAAAAAVLREHIAAAGTGAPRAVDPQGRLSVRGASGPALFACERGFVDPRAPFEQLACRTTAGAGAGIAIRHAADGLGSLLSADGLPLDCLGNGIGAVPSDDPAAPDDFPADTRLYLSRPGSGSRYELYCKGSGAAAPQALVGGIEDLRFAFAVDGAAGRRWLAPGQLAAGDWPGVVAVRFCFVAASATEVTDAPVSYSDCADATVRPLDRRIYRRGVGTVRLAGGRQGLQP